jgi:hypothetical protein
MTAPQRSVAVAGTTPADRLQASQEVEKRTPPISCTVIHDRGSEEMRFSRENVERLLAGDSSFWIDVDQPGKGAYGILREVFKFHPLAALVTLFKNVAGSNGPALGIRGSNAIRATPDRTGVSG